MFSSLTTKLALRKVGIKGDTFDFASPKSSKGTNGTQPGLDEEETSNNWPAWMSARKLPLTAQAWLSPVPPPVPIAECPKVNDLAPLDRDRQLTFGGGKKIVVLFLRCVGCAFAQRSFLALRTLANKHQGQITCIAVSHSSPEATRKWLDLLGGAWNVDIVIDEDRAIYAAWGLGLHNVWSYFNPQTQREAWKEKGWLGEKVATAVGRTGSFNANNPAAKGNLTAPGSNRPAAGAGAAAAAGDLGPDGGPSTVMGNKWQQAGLFAIDGRGTVVWAEKAVKADQALNFEDAGRALRV
ncbi:hypothetical protein BJ170DRAFT_161644 [Xylariales sp. AK1849]|nr:hypothetical protein BJ170DRAFT_161644 [Xylariales sp. AK1849]